MSNQPTPKPKPPPPMTVTHHGKPSAARIVDVLSEIVGKQRKDKPAAYAGCFME